MTRACTDRLPWLLQSIETYKGADKEYAHLMLHLVCMLCPDSYKSTFSRPGKTTPSWVGDGADKVMRLISLPVTLWPTMWILIIFEWID